MVETAVEVALRAERARVSTAKRAQRVSGGQERYRGQRGRGEGETKRARKVRPDSLLFVVGGRKRSRGREQGGIRREGRRIFEGRTGWGRTDWGERRRKKERKSSVERAKSAFGWWRRDRMSGEGKVETYDQRDCRTRHIRMSMLQTSQDLIYTYEEQKREKDPVVSSPAGTLQ